MSIELFLATVLVLNLVVSLFFVLKTRSHSSKMLVSLLFSTSAVAVLLLLFSNNCSLDQLLDIALVFVLLSAITATIFAKRSRIMKDS